MSHSKPTDIKPSESRHSTDPSHPTHPNRRLYESQKQLGHASEELRKRTEEPAKAALWELEQATRHVGKAKELVDLLDGEVQG